MITEMISGVWICNHEDIFNQDFLKDNLISVIINCTKDKAFPNVDVRKVRVPVSDMCGSQDIQYLQDNMNVITKFIHSNIEENNIIIFGYDNYTVPSIIVGAYLKNIGELPNHVIKDVMISKNKNIRLDLDISIF